MNRGTAYELSDRMQAALALMSRDLDSLFGSRRARIEPVTYEVRESSEVTRARVTLPTGDQHIFIKLLKPRRSDETPVEIRARLRRDFEITSRVYAAMKRTSDLCAVEPITYDDGLLCMVTREAPGVRLDALARTGARWPASDARLGPLEIALRRTGRWLAVFQKVALTESPSPLDLEGIRAYIDVRLQRLAALPVARFGESDRRAVLAYVECLAGEVPSDDLVEVPAHGDMTLSNIVATPEGVTVLDFGMASRAGKYFDLARLYTQLDFYTAKPQYRPHVIARLQQAALLGFEPGLRRAHPLFEMYAAQHVICHFLSHVRAPGRFPASVYSRQQCRLHRRWLRERAHAGCGSSSPPQDVAVSSV